MYIHHVVLRKVRMNLKHPFETSFGSMQEKDFYIIEVTDDQGNIGYGETVAFTKPWYTEETTDTILYMLNDFLIDLLKGQNISHPDEITKILSPIRRNNMAKAALEGAIWDVYAKRNNQSLAEALGGEKSTIDVGVSIGIEENIDDLLQIIETYVQEGYKRIKLKIKPGKDINVLHNVREKFPTTPIMVDANSAYTLDDIEVLKQLDQFNLMMIEQPLGQDDIMDHAQLQKELQTPICLDESIHSLKDAQMAIQLNSCKIINIKIGRVGGLTESRKIHDYCAAHGIDVWCGGMLESGIGRAHNIALTTLSSFTMPGDTSGSSRYWHKDIVTPEVTMDEGVIHVPTGSGIGYDIDHEALEEFTLSTKHFHLNASHNDQK